MAIPTFEDARSWFQKNAAKFESKTEAEAGYIKQFKLTEALVITKLGKESNWVNSGRLFGALREGVNVNWMPAKAPSTGTRASKVGQLKMIFQQARQNPQEANWEELGIQAIKVLYPASKAKQQRAEAQRKKLEAQLEQMQAKLKALQGL